MEPSEDSRTAAASYTHALLDLLRYAHRDTDRAAGQQQGAANAARACSTDEQCRSGRHASAEVRAGVVRCVGGGGVGGGGEGGGGDGGGGGYLQSVSHSWSHEQG